MSDKRARRRAYSTSQDAERSLMDIHDWVVFPFVTIHLLKNMKKVEMCMKRQGDVKLSHTDKKTKQKETHLIKVQPHYNVWLFCELMHCFQEVHMANI